MRVSLTPESITVVDEATRDRWVVETAEQTLERIEAMDVEIREGDYSEDIGRALEAYNEDAPLGEYEQSAKEALAQVAGVEGEIEGDDESEAEARSE